MSKNKKIDLFGFIVFGVLLLSIVMAIVGICIDWTAGKIESIIGNSESISFTLSELAKNDTDSFTVMQTFAYITLALTGAATITFVVSKFLNLGFFKFIVVVVCVLLIVSAIITIATTFSFCGNYKIDGGLVGTKCVPAAGAWLLTIFSVIGGLAGIVGALKKQ